MTTPRENMLKVLRHEQPDWIPLWGHVDPYNQPSREGMDPELDEALGTIDWRSEGTVIFSRYLGLDIMDNSGPPVRVTRRNVTVEHTTDGAETTELWHTPVGDLRGVSRRVRDDGTSYRVEHVVKSPEDLPALAAIFEDELIEPNPDAMPRLLRRRELISEGGLMLCAISGTPLGMMYRVYSGVATLAYLYADAPDALADLFEVMERNYSAQLDIGAQAGVFDAGIGMDDTSTTTISPAMFERYNLHLTDARADICHSGGCAYFHHSCGLIRNLLPLYRRTKMDAVHAFTVPPIGDVTVVDGKRALGDRITIIAGVAELAEPDHDPERMRTNVRRFFTDAAPGDNFMLGLAGYPHKNMEQTRQVVDECHKYQRMYA